jgi:alpha/beta superfamily hydrolase
MMIAERLTTVRAGAETLEARLAAPPGARVGVVVSHPHPLYGGDMDNPVVDRIVEVCTARGIATLRFNFRGVGASSGRHDDGHGEQEDVRASLAHLQDVLGAGARVALAGYSFGAAMAAAVATTVPVAGLALVAPPMRVADIQRPSACAGPIVVVAGAEDQYCPAPALEALRAMLPEATVIVIEGADHFFFGSLMPLGDAVGAWAGALADG